MKLTEKKVEEIAKRSKSYKDFSWNLHEATEPYRPIREARIGEYVRIRAKTYGRKSTTEFTSPATEGKIMKFNPKSVVVRVSTYATEEGDNKENLKYPSTAKVSDDLSVLFKMMKGKNKETFYESYWKRVSGKRPRKHPSYTFNDIIDVQEKRSKRAKTMDTKRTAKNTFGLADTDEFYKWLKRPNRFDIIGVDTKKGRK